MDSSRHLNLPRTQWPSAVPPGRTSSIFAETHVAAVIFIAAWAAMPHAVTTMDKLFIQKSAALTFSPADLLGSLDAYRPQVHLVRGKCLCEHPTHGCVHRGNT